MSIAHVSWGIDSNDVIVHGFSPACQRPIDELEGGRLSTLDSSIPSQGVSQITAYLKCITYVATDKMIISQHTLIRSGVQLVIFII